MSTCIQFFNKADFLIYSKSALKKCKNSHRYMPALCCTCFGQVDIEYNSVLVELNFSS